MRLADAEKATAIGKRRHDVREYLESLVTDRAEGRLVKVARPGGDEVVAAIVPTYAKPLDPAEVAGVVREAIIKLCVAKIEEMDAQLAGLGVEP